MRVRSIVIASMMCLGLSVQASGQDWDKVEIETVDLGSGVYVLYGSGGNIGLSIGDDGIFMIDDQFAPLSEKISDAISQLSDQPVTFLLNTHWHGDHVGGNETFGEQGAIIVSHDNVRKRLSSTFEHEIFGQTIEALGDDGLPVVTFSDTATFHFNGNEIFVFHAEAGHTDGDTIVFFRNLNIVHMGDTLFTGRLPLIDAFTGGTIYGAIAAHSKVLEMIDADTVVIPGHGKVGGREDLSKARDLLVSIRDAIQPLVDQGMSVEEVTAARPLASLELDYGRWNEQQFTFVIASGMKPQ